MKKHTLFYANDGTIYISDGDILCKAELQAALGISRATVQRWMREGLPCTRYANNIIGYDLAAVREWMNKVGYTTKKIMREDG